MPIVCAAFAIGKIMKEKRCAVLQSNYVPWKGYFDLINSVDEFIIYDCVQYTKHDWRNRNKIKTAAGSKWITIPVAFRTDSSILQGNCSYATIENAVIVDQGWRKKHWTAISQNYSRANYFEDYAEIFETLYGGEQTNLSIINQTFIRAICQLLEISTKIDNASNYQLSGDRNQRLVNLCKQSGSSTYVSGPAARDYLDLSLFASENIKVEWMGYGDYPEYSQLFPPFDHFVSVLDLVFNEGTNARQFMKSFAARPLL